MTLPSYLDPLGSGNSDPYKKDTVLAYSDNKVTTVNLSKVKKGVYYLILAGGGGKYSSDGWNGQGGGGGAAWEGEIKIKKTCNIQLISGNRFSNNPANTSYFKINAQDDDMIYCTGGTNASGGNGVGTAGSPNVKNTTNQYFEVVKTDISKKGIQPSWNGGQWGSVCSINNWGRNEGRVNHGGSNGVIGGFKFTYLRLN